VIHVGVRDKNGVNGRHLFHTKTGAPLSPQNDQTVHEDGIDQKIFSADLKEEGRVSDEGDAGLSGGYKLGPPGLTHNRLFVTFTHDSPELPHLRYRKWPAPPKAIDRTLLRAHI
jgi:hypothetical protein